MSWVGDGWTFLAVPHSASTSLIQWLRSEYGVVRRGVKHSVYPLEGMVWYVYRDPVDRAVAMWRKQGVEGNLCGELCLFDPGCSFERYAQALANRELPAFGDHRRIAVCGHVEFLSGVPDGVDLRGVRFDRLPDGLRALPFVRPDDPLLLPRENVLTRSWLEPEVTDAARDWVWAWEMCL